MYLFMTHITFGSISRNLNNDSEERKYCQLSAHRHKSLCLCSASVQSTLCRVVTQPQGRSMISSEPMTLVLGTGTSSGLNICRVRPAALHVIVRDCAWLCNTQVGAAGGEGNGCVCVLHTADTLWSALLPRRLVLPCIACKYPVRTAQ